MAREIARNANTLHNTARKITMIDIIRSIRNEYGIEENVKNPHDKIKRTLKKGIKNKLIEIYFITSKKDAPNGKINYGAFNSKLKFVIFSFLIPTNFTIDFATFQGQP